MIKESLQRSSPPTPSRRPIPAMKKRTVDLNRIGATVQFENPSLPAASSLAKKTADESDIAKTLMVSPTGQSPAGPADGPAVSSRSETPPSSKDALIPPPRPSAADAQRIAATYDSGSLPAPVDPAAAESHRFAQTYDSQKLSAELASKVSMAWPAKIDEGSTPRTSIKAEGQPIDEKANLNIQSRVLRAINVPGNSRADYELLSELGKGGMGIVHNARQASIDRTVALKKIKPEKAQEAEARQDFPLGSGRDRRSGTSEHRADLRSGRG